MDKQNYPDWLDLKAWAEFVQHRKEIGKKLTPLAEKKNLKVLEKQKHLQQEIIDRAIGNSWQGLFPIRESTQDPARVNDDWLQKGKEVGLSPRAGESWPAFKRRVQNRVNH